MTKKLTSLIAVISIAMSMNLTAGAAGQRRDLMKHTRFGIHMAEKSLFAAHLLMKFKDQIGLTEDQVKKIEKMQELFQEATIRKQADIEVKELKLRSYLKKENVDRGEMEKMIREIAGMKTGLQIDQMNYLLDLKDLLTPGQLEKIESLKKEKRHEMMENRGFRRGENHWRNRMQHPGPEVKDEEKKPGEQV